LEKVRRAIDEFLELGKVVTRRWRKGAVLEEVRKARHHEEESSC